MWKYVGGEGGGGRVAGIGGGAGGRVASGSLSEGGVGFLAVVVGTVGSVGLVVEGCGLGFDVIVTLIW